MNFNKFERTAQLFDYQTMEGTIRGYYLDSNGNLQESFFAAVTNYIPCSGGKFCLAKVGGISTSICLYDNNKNFLYGQPYNTASGSDKQTIVVNSSVNASYIRFTYFYTAAPQDDLSTIMLNAGSTALPYEPYKDWHDIPHYLHNTSTDTLTTLPADLYADGNNATVGLVGNMYQASGVSPTTPIQPQECGERTENLFNIATVRTGYRIKWSDGTDYADETAIMSDYIPVTIGTYKITPAAIFVGYDSNKNYVGVYRGDTGEWIKSMSLAVYTVNVANDSDVSYIRLLSYGDTAPLSGNTMFNVGNTMLPFEPYGYKIPISSANTTTPVYLRQVQTTRKIRKLVLKGEESVTTLDIGNHIFALRGIFNSEPELLQVGGVCTHYKYNNAVSSLSANMQNGDFVLNKIVDDYSFAIKDNSLSTSTDFKDYLQQQYAAGTPVTVWYVLATPTTGIVNEPIRKIGNYADTVSGISIPTIAGADSFDVLTTLKPSEVSLAYTGWHDAEVKEWDGSQWQ